MPSSALRYFSLLGTHMLAALCRLGAPASLRSLPLLRQPLPPRLGRRALCGAPEGQPGASPPPPPPPPPPPEPEVLTMPPPAGAPPDRFAVMSLGGTQYKVAVDDLITVEKMRGFNVGEVFRNESVLLVGSKSATVIGAPLVEGAYVEATIEEQALASKEIVFKKKRRKGYRRWKGVRAPLTVVRINGICVPPRLEEQIAPPPGGS